MLTQRNTAHFYAVNNLGLADSEHGQVPTWPGRTQEKPNSDGAGGRSSVPTNACPLPSRAGVTPGELSVGGPILSDAGKCLF